MRMDAKVKEQAEMLFSELGLTLTAAVNMFLRQAVYEAGLPFTPNRRPNAATLAAIEESERLLNDPGAKRFSNYDELMADLNDEV
jgi:DNA-damage-inducible protein J